MGCFFKATDTKSKGKHHRTRGLALESVLRLLPAVCEKRWRETNPLAHFLHKYFSNEMIAKGFALAHFNSSLRLILTRSDSSTALRLLAAASVSAISVCLPDLTCDAAGAFAEQIPAKAIKKTVIKWSVSNV